MSWDVLIMAGEQGGSMGDAAKVRSLISSSLPGVNWHDPANGHLRTAELSVEFQHQQSGATEDIMLRFRGSGDPMSLIVKLCSEHDWIAIEAGTARAIDLENPSSGSWRELKKYQQELSEHLVPRSNWINDHPALFGWSVFLILILALRWMTRNRFT